MASGMPDYQRIIRPKYGGARQGSGYKTAVASTVTDLITLTGRGMIYGGSVWLDYTLSQANSVVYVVLDDWLVSSLSFKRLNDYNVVDPRKSVISLNKYDAVNYIYSVGISYGLTFEGSLRVTYGEGHGRTPVVHYNIVYALL